MILIVVLQCLPIVQFGGFGILLGYVVVAEGIVEARKALKYGEVVLANEHQNDNAERYSSHRIQLKQPRFVGDFVDFEPLLEQLPEIEKHIQEKHRTHSQLGVHDGVFKRLDEGVVGSQKRQRDGAGCYES